MIDFGELIEGATSTFKSIFGIDEDGFSLLGAVGGLGAAAVAVGAVTYSVHNVGRVLPPIKMVEKYWIWLQTGTAFSNLPIDDQDRYRQEFDLLYRNPSGKGYVKGKAQNIRELRQGARAFKRSGGQL